MQEKINKYSLKFICGVALVVFVILATMNVFVTGYFKTTYAEWTYFRIDWFWLSLPLIVGIIFLFAFLQRKFTISRMSSRIIMIVLMVYTTVWGIGWILLSKSTLVADRYYVSAIAESFVRGDYSWYDTGRYLFLYPFQTGIAAFIEIIYRIFGVGNYNAVKVVNVLAVALSFVAIYRCTGIIFGQKHKKRIQNIMLLLCFGCIAPMFFVTYVYGNLVGMAFAYWAVYFQLRYMTGGRGRDMIIACLLITVACILKNNYMIFLVAMVIFAFLDGLRKKKIKNQLFTVLILVCYLVGSKSVMAYYAARADVTINDGIPKIMWIQMGMKEGWFGYGTYDDSTVQLYIESGYDAKEATGKAMDIIKDRLGELAGNPGYGISFLLQKTALSWCEPTYMSIWESNCADNHYGEISDFAQNIYTGELHHILVFFMDMFQSLIWICTVVYLIINRKEMNEEKLFIITIILGGVAFHTFWEAKSQYVLQYFILLLPYAAAGLHHCIELVNRNFFPSKYKKEFE